VRAERQNAQMSKITNDGLTWSGTGYFKSCTQMATVGVKGLMTTKCSAHIELGTVCYKQPTE